LPPELPTSILDIQLVFCLLFSAIHCCATNAAADLAGLEGGERAVAGGPTGDVHGTQRNES